MSELFGNAAFVTVIAAAVTGLSGYFLARLNKDKVAADTRRVDIDTETVAVRNAEKVVELLGKRLDRVEAEHAQCQDDIVDLRARVVVLERALRDNDIPLPKYSPQVQRRRDFREQQRNQPEGDTE